MISGATDRGLLSFIVEHLLRVSTVGADRRSDPDLPFK